MTRSLMLPLLLAGLSQQPSQAPPVDTSCPELASALRAVVRNDVRLRDWAQLDRYRAAPTG